MTQGHKAPETGLTLYHRPAIGGGNLIRSMTLIAMCSEHSVVGNFEVYSRVQLRITLWNER